MLFPAIGNGLVSASYVNWPSRLTVAFVNCTGRRATTTTITITLFFEQKYKRWMVRPTNSWKASCGGARQVHE